MFFCKATNRSTTQCFKKSFSHSSMYHCTDFSFSSCSRRATFQTTSYLSLWINFSKSISRNAIRWSPIPWPKGSQPAASHWRRSDVTKIASIVFVPQLCVAGSGNECLWARMLVRLLVCRSVCCNGPLSRKKSSLRSMQRIMWSPF